MFFQILRNEPGFSSSLSDVCKADDDLRSRPLLRWPHTLWAAPCAERREVGGAGGRETYSELCPPAEPFPRTSAPRSQANGGTRDVGPRGQRSQEYSMSHP